MNSPSDRFELSRLAVGEATSESLAPLTAWRSQDGRIRAESVPNRGGPGWPV